jgi:hypothetical protein
MVLYSGRVLAGAVGVKALLPKLSSEDKNQQTHDADNDVHPDAKPEEKRSVRSPYSGEFQRDLSGGHAPYGEPDGDRTDDQKGEPFRSGKLTNRKHLCTPCRG